MLIRKINSKVKKRWIKRLNRLKVLYEQEGDQLGKGQRKITKFFGKVNKEIEGVAKEVDQQYRR